MIYLYARFVSLAIIYIVFSIFNWFAPPVVALIGPKWSMVIGGVGYFLFILSFLKPMTWALYLGSVIVGLAAPIIWTGAGGRGPGTDQGLTRDCPGTDQGLSRD